MNSHYNLLRKLEDAPKEYEGHPLLCVPSTPDPRDYKFINLMIQSGLPLAEELVTIDYRSNLPNCFDQLSRGSCVACASAWSPKAYQEIIQGDFPMNGLSAAYLYAMCKKIDGLSGQEGTTVKAAMQVLKGYGICSEDTMPYLTLSNLSAPYVPSISSTATTEASKYKISSYAQICSLSDTNRSSVITAMRTALKNQGPFVIALLVCSNFAPNSEGKLPLPSGTIQGGHAVSIVGDLPDQECFILRNSWGISWGLNGYAYLPYSWITNKVDDYWTLYEAWTATDISVPKAANKIIMTPGSDIAIIDGTKIKLNTSIKTIDNWTMFPSRLTNNLGYNVTWDGTNVILTKV